ncbi:MAG: VanW family protein, partial [Clostridiales bacterium]|nr:VanW family protein [Clostridiales bacterium]
MPKPMYVRNLVLSIFAAAPLAFFPSGAQSDCNTVETASVPMAVAAPIVEEQPRETAKVTINADGKFFTYSDELITPSDFTVAEEIEKRRINYPLDQKIELVDAFIQKGASYKTALLYCFPRLEYTVDDVARYLYVAPVDAAVVYKNGKFSVSSERIGQALDEDRLYGGLYYSLKFFGGDKTVGASVVSLMPSVRAHELRQNLTLRSTYTTDFSTSTSSRAHNVETAVRKFDGISIGQGETLSFNATVGARTEENGFKTAKIIVDGKYVDGVGGGVCQASTAVYNAAIIAGLDAIANAHSICPSYCPPGLDAMISTASDLVITNNTESAVYFSVRAENGKATVR